MQALDNKYLRALGHLTPYIELAGELWPEIFLGYLETDCRKPENIYVQVKVWQWM